MKFSMVLLALFATSLLAVHVAAHDTTQQDYGDYSDYTDCTDGTFETEDGSRFVGGTLLMRKRLVSVSSCLRACEADQDCNTFNYVKARRACFLFAEDESELDTVDSSATTIGYLSCSGSGDYADVQYTDQVNNKSGGKNQGKGKKDDEAARGRREGGGDG